MLPNYVISQAVPLPQCPLPDPAMPLTIIRKSLQNRTTRSRRSTRTNRTMRRSRNWESSIAKPDRPLTASESSEIQDSRQVAGFMSRDSLEAKCQEQASDVSTAA